jgi:hypothetical protein
MDLLEISGKLELNIAGIGSSIAMANPKKDFLNANKIDNVLKDYETSKKIATK